MKTRPRLNTPHQFKWSGILLLGFALAAVYALATPLTQAAGSQPVERTIHVRASSFEYTPATIRVNRGDIVTLEIESTDVVHGIAIDGYDLRLDAEPGKISRLTFTADRSGVFRFRCPVTCGALHPFMIGKLYVGNNSLYWGAMLAAGLAAVVGLWSVRK
jgi:heme/copper-type cytochrome/quinol oxidase subunit 2